MTPTSMLRSDFTTEPGRLNICMVAPSAYGALIGGARGHVGGVERQVSFMASWLAARGHRVSVVTWDEGQEDGVLIDGVQVLKICSPDQGWPGFRFFHPRWTSLNAALGRADADLYYNNCAESVTGQVALWSRRHGRRFVYSVAHDMECEPELRGMHRREKVLYLWGLRHADQVIVQTLTQQRMLQESFGVRSREIPMPCPGPAAKDFITPEPPDPGSARILWMARVTEIKRPDRLLDLAEACPDLHFDLVGPAENTAYVRRVLERAARIPNLTAHGRASRAQVAAFYRNAACLCCTSDHEGFPNTFLEAWSHGLPVISTFDPDGLIASKGLGGVGADVGGLAAAIRGLLASPARWRESSARARQHFLENHTVDQVMARFEGAFQDVMTGPTCTPTRPRGANADLRARPEGG